MPFNEIERDGFTSSFGRFHAPHRVEAVPSSQLKELFLPRITPAGFELVHKYNQHFVRGQFKHYGVDFDEDEFRGCGVGLLQEKLQCGDMDRIPLEIQDLKDEMHAEWLHNLTPKELAVLENPRFIMEKYFLDARGRATRTKLNVMAELEGQKPVVCIPFPFNSMGSHAVNELRKAADELNLCHVVLVDKDASEQVVRLGWDDAYVMDFDRHDVNGTTGGRGEDEGDEETEYSPAGKYSVTCEQVENNWPRVAENMSMNIYPVQDQPGIFEAVFDFGIYEGMMVLGTSEEDVDRRCRELDRQAERTSDDDSENNNEDDSDDEYTTKEEEEDSDKTTTGTHVGVKRGPLPTRLRGPRPPNKKAKTTSTTSATSTVKKRTYFVGLRCRENDGHIQLELVKGIMKFKGATLGSFILNCDDFCALGDDAVFEGRKLDEGSEEAKNLSCYGVSGRWEDYSESKYEWERTSRWGGGGGGWRGRGW